MSTIYSLWKAERETWLRGSDVFAERVLPDALVIVPPLFEPQRFSQYQLRSAGTSPFSDVNFSQRTYAEKGATTVLSYHAEATHPNYKGFYEANCSTVYVCIDDEWKVLCHHHVPMGDTLKYFQDIAESRRAS